VIHDTIRATAGVSPPRMALVEVAVHREAAEARMSIVISQANRPLRAKAPVGANVLIPVALIGDEELSRPFLYTVDFVSTDHDVQAIDVLDKPMLLELVIPGRDEPRVVHGFVRRFAHVARDDTFSHYRAEIVPELWFASLSAATRTFEGKTAVEIVDAVCRGADVATGPHRVSVAPPAIPYVVQYGESNLDFVARLLEGAGLYYRFRHDDERDVLVISDAVGDAIPAGQVPTLPINPRTVSGVPAANSVLEVSRDFIVHSSQVSLSDHDFLRPDDVGNTVSRNPGARGARSEFLGDLGPQLSAAESTRRIEMYEATHQVIRGRSNCPALQAGTRVRLTGGPFGAAGQDVLLLRVTHSMRGGDVTAGNGATRAAGATYVNEFLAVPASTRFRPPRLTRRPSVQGTQSAIVVGQGEDGDIDVDGDGRVLLQFPWDTGAGMSGRSQHRVHVASVWAGAGWGFVQPPRLGQEVLVEYFEGDPARPVITGRVYNSTHRPPYGLPGATKTQSGVKTRSLPRGGTQNFNEIRFDDKKGAEQIRVQAENALDSLVKGSETRVVGGQRTTTITKDDAETITEGNYSLQVEKGSYTCVAHENHNTKVTDGDQFITVQSGDQRTAIVNGNQITDVDTGSRVVNVKTDQTTTVKGKRKATITGDDEIEIEDGDLLIKAKSGRVRVEAATSIVFKVGASKIEITKDSVRVDSPEVVVQAAGETRVIGSIVKVESEGMLKLKSAVTTVNGSGVLKMTAGSMFLN
jgi:type VI secretion system secreted protein VgrG